jgi:azurin
MHRLSIAALLSFGLAVAALSIGCERRNSTEEPDSGAETEQAGDADTQNAGDTGAAQKADQEADAQTGEPRTVTLEPEGNEMKYATTELTAKPGEPLELVFDNAATDDSMKHNVVFLDTDDTETARQVAQTGWKLPDQKYVPENDAILAFTDISAPGKTVEMTFTAPEEPGEYLYICTYPGHYPSMKGTLVVEEE